MDTFVRLRVKKAATNSRCLFYGGVRLIDLSIKRESTVLISSATFGTCKIFHLIIQVNFSMANFECPFEQETEKSRVIFLNLRRIYSQKDKSFLAIRNSSSRKTFANTPSYIHLDEDFCHVFVFVCTSSLPRGRSKGFVTRSCPTNVRGVETRDEPLRTSAWEATAPHDTVKCDTTASQ